MKLIDHDSGKLTRISKLGISIFIACLVALMVLFYLFYHEPKDILQKSTLAPKIAVGDFKKFTPKDTAEIILYIEDIWGMDLKEGTVHADFYLSVWSNHAPPRIELMNGIVTYRDTIYHKDVYNRGKPYTEIHMQATIRDSFRYDHFPFDNQIITLTFESTATSDSLFMYNKGANEVINQIHLPGWTATDVRMRNVKNYYTAFEQNEFTKYTYDDVECKILIKNKDLLWFGFKTLIPNLIAVAIIFMGFFFKREKIDARIGLGTGSLFLMITCLITSQQNLPQISIITLSEKFNLITLFVIALMIMLFSIDYKESLTTKDGKGVSRIFLISLAIAIGYLSILIFLLSHIFVIQNEVLSSH